MFLFKKIISPFFYPISLVLILTILGLIFLFFTRRQTLGKALILIGVSVLAFFSFSSTIGILIRPLEEKYPPYLDENSLKTDRMPKIVVVLGGGFSPNPAPPVVSRLAYESLVRLVHGIRLYHMIPKGKLLLSGGRTTGSGSSAEIMAQIAKEIGVNEKDIIIEAKSKDTKDEAGIINSILGDEPFILVTSASHMPRSMALFKKLGMNPVPAPTTGIVKKLYSHTPSPFHPSSINLQKAETAFHEYIGILWARLIKQI